MWRRLAELGRQPTYDEYSQIMTGFTPEQIPVLSGLARGFGVFGVRALKHRLIPVDSSR